MSVSSSGYFDTESSSYVWSMDASQNFDFTDSISTFIPDRSPRKSKIKFVALIVAILVLFLVIGGKFAHDQIVDDKAQILLPPPKPTTPVVAPTGTASQGNLWEVNNSHMPDYEPLPENKKLTESHQFHPRWKTGSRKKDYTLNKKIIESLGRSLTNQPNLIFPRQPEELTINLIKDLTNMGTIPEGEKEDVSFVKQKLAYYSLDFLNYLADLNRYKSGEATEVINPDIAFSGAFKSLAKLEIAESQKMLVPKKYLQVAYSLLVCEYHIKRLMANEFREISSEARKYIVNERQFRGEKSVDVEELKVRAFSEKKMEKIRGRNGIPEMAAFFDQVISNLEMSDSFLAKMQRVDNPPT